jgi:hypothetical protein
MYVEWTQAALGGEEAMLVMTGNGKLMQQLVNRLDNSHNSSTLQRLTGVFNHLSRSEESARALEMHGVHDALRRLVARPERADVSGSAEAHEAYVGLANMAMANIIVHQEQHIPQLDRSQIPAIKSIVGFLQCALEKRYKSGILFRVHDVLYALDSISKAHEPSIIGIECGLVDLAVQVTAEWRPGLYAATFSDAKASTHPVLELATNILQDLAHR